jgi:DNA-binding NarL/FixJ family response regulator
MGKLNLNLFVIEDDDIDFQAIKRSLDKANSQSTVIRAKNGSEALVALEEESITKPTIFLVDLQMPKLNGIEFLHHLRKSQKYHDSAVFVLSTSADPGDIFDCYRYQIAAYFEKSQLGASCQPLIDMLNLYENYISLPSEYL